MGKNNIQLREEKSTTIQHWGLRKLSVGVASVLLGTTAYLGISNGAVVHADTVMASNNNENVTTSNNGTLSQNLYQSDRIQTSKTAVNADSVEDTQTTIQDVTSSKNDNHLIAANNSIKQVDGQQNYQQAKQSVSTENQLNPYLVLAVQDNNNSSGSTELNDNNSWGSTIHYTYGTDAQLTEDQKKIGYVADSSKAGQAVYPDSQIKVGFDSQQNQMKVTVDGQKVSFTQKDKGYKTGTSDVATDYDNLKGHVYRLFDITFKLPLNSSDGNYHGTYNTYTLQCSSDMTNGKLVFKTQDTALNDYFYQQKFATEFKYVDYSNDKTVYQTIPGPDVLSNGQTVTYQYQAPKGYDLLLSSKTLTMTLNSNGFSYSGYWKLDPSSTPTHYVFLVPVTKTYTPPKVDESFGQITGGVITEDGKPFDFNSGWWGQTRYGLDFATHSFKEKSKTDWINDLKTQFDILTDELGIMNDKHITSVYDYMNSGQAAKDFPFFGNLNICLPIDSSGKWLTNADYSHPSRLGDAKVNIYPFFNEEVFSGYNVWISPNVTSSLSSDLDNMHTLWGLDSSVFSKANSFVNSFPDQVLKQNGAVTGVLQYQGIRVTAKDNKSGKVLSVNNLDYLSFLKQYNYQYLLDNMKKGISYDFSVIVKPYSYSVQKKNYTVHFRYANGPKAGQTFRNDWHGYVNVIMLDNIPIAYSMDGTVAGFSDINPAGPIPNGMYLTATGYFSNPKAFLKSNESNLLNYTFVNQTDTTYPGTGDYFDGYQAGVIGIDGSKLTPLLSPNYRIDKDNLLFADKDQLFYNTPRFNWNTITRDQALQMANSYDIYKQRKNTSLDYIIENVDPTPAELTVNALYTEPTTKVTLNYVDATSNKVLSTSTLNLNTNVVTGADLAMPENYALVSKPTSQSNVNLVYGADGNLSTVSLTRVSSTPIVINLKVKHSAAQQTIIVKYVDDDDNGRVLQTDTVKGPAGSSSTYTTAKELGILRNQHYVLSSDETNGRSLVFDTDNNKDQVYTVHVKHDTEEEAVTSMTVNGKIFYANTPGNLAKVPSDQMPSTQNISYSAGGYGCEIVRDLVTNRWRIDRAADSLQGGLLKQVNGFWLVPVVSSSPLLDQHIWGLSWEMARAYLVGLTGSGDSGSGSWMGADIKVDLAEDDDSTFMGPSVKATVTINFHFQYMPKAESAKITYVDDTTGNTLKTEEIAADYNTYVGMGTPGGPDVTRAANGYGSKIQFKTDPAAQIKLYQDQGYQLVSSNFTEGSTFKDGDDINVFTVHLAHAHQNVTHDYIVTRTINYVDANGTHLKPSTVQKLTFTRTGVQDLITKQITWNATPAQSFAAVNDLNILGYKTDTTSVPELMANWDDQNSTVDVHYQVADSTVTVNLVDTMGHVIVTTPVTGQVGSTVHLTAQVPDGWVAYNTDIPTRVVIGANPTSINYLIAHRVVFVKPTDGVKAGNLIPGAKTKTFNDKVNADNLVTHASYTVNIWADEAHTRKLFTKTYHADFVRNALVDAITGDVYYYNWSEGGKHVFAGFTRQASDGYQTVVAPSWIATQADPTKTVDLVAQSQQAVGVIQYQTTDGKVISTQAFTGNNAVALTAPKGYTLMTDETIVMPTSDKDQTYVVYVRPTQTLYTVADKLPEGMESLSKTITRTIHITEANGHIRTITQRVHFTRTATIKADGSVEYTDWKATGRAVMSKVFLPKRRGYHIVVDGDLVKQNVTANMSDSVVTVKYIKD